MLFWLIIGVALGYIFKPQLEIFIGRLILSLQNKRREDNTK